MCCPWTSKSSWPPIWSRPADLIQTEVEPVPPSVPDTSADRRQHSPWLPRRIVAVAVPKAPPVLLGGDAADGDQLPVLPV